MEIVSITLGIILLLCCFAILIFMDGEERGIATLPLFFGIVFLAAGIGVLHDERTPKEPTALDVYRGNTTLEITYRDSIAIDSTVVFKK